MGALGILQEKSDGKDVEQSKNTSENIDFDCRIFQLKSTKIYSQRNDKKVYSFFTNIYISPWNIAFNLFEDDNT